MATSEWIKDRIDIKKRELEEELRKPKKDQNNFKVKRLISSINRHKRQSYFLAKKRRRLKQKWGK